ncbi:Wzz/FepE/Etk N-terminal domain-containing protein [Rhizobium oryzicola]|uniref:non-specific protein-tyrosine kinase n=1 Tax=Rhizobium oryzicola TaxID=1232668 RepID=A0ABT8T218_9HYPH|nr:Wzz/FepE/Etk N-terminal domain-containing protein [Rhizobium oryzicola]MDO1584183.1 Wzz/FepE/Etk N-terminal domain-containing protein [Rhizobium oryzicola]
MDQINFRTTTTYPGAPRETDSFIDLDRLFTIVMRRLKLIGICVVVAMVLAGAYLLVTPSTYTAMTQILIDENLSRYAEEEQNAQSAQQIDNRIASAVEILKSKALALRVTDEAGLADNDTFLNPPASPIALAKDSVKSILALVKRGGPTVSEADARNGRREKAAAMLQQALEADRVGRSSVIAVSVKSSTPQLSARIARAYAEAYVSEQLNANFEATERASNWLQERLTELNNRSQEASMAVEKYKIDHGLISPRGELLSAQQLSDLTSQLIVAQADAATATARYQQYKAIVDQGQDAAVNNAIVSSRDTDNTVIQDLRKRYVATAERERGVVDQFGADHPQAKMLESEKSQIGQQIYRELQQLTSGFRNDAEVAGSREKSLRDSIDRVAGRNSEANVSLVQLRELEQKATSLKALYQTYLDRFEQALQQRSFPIAKARVISSAGIPSAPSSPRKTLTMALSIVLGLFVGGGIATVLELKERSLRVGQDVRSQLGLRFLGYLPLLSASTKAALAETDKSRNALVKAGGGTGGVPEDAKKSFNEKLRRVTAEYPRSGFTETLRNTKLACDLALPGRSCRVIAVISALPGEGKSTIAANLAVLLGSMNKRTLLLDADPHDGGSSGILGAEPLNGLMEVLRGEAPWTSAITLEPTANLAILPIASPNKAMPHTSELLASADMTRLMETVGGKFDYVVVDLAPLVPSIDAKAFAHHVDAFVWVAEWGETPVKLIRSLMDAEPSISSKTAGVILNKTDMDELPKYADPGAPERFRARYAPNSADEPAMA